MWAMVSIVHIKKNYVFVIFILSLLYTVINIAIFTHVPNKWIERIKTTFKIVVSIF